jgi:hypothetical protein
VQFSLSRNLQLESGDKVRVSTQKQNLAELQQSDKILLACNLRRERREVLNKKILRGRYSGGNKMRCAPTIGHDCQGACRKCVPLEAQHCEASSLATSLSLFCDRHQQAAEVATEWSFQAYDHGIARVSNGHQVITLMHVPQKVPVKSVSSALQT